MTTVTIEKLSEGYVVENEGKRFAVVRVPLAAGSSGMDRKDRDASPPHRYDVDPEFPDDEDNEEED